MTVRVTQVHLNALESILRALYDDAAAYSARLAALDLTNDERKLLHETQRRVCTAWALDRLHERFDWEIAEDTPCP